MFLLSLMLSVNMRTLHAGNLAWLISIVSVTRSGILWQMDLWACRCRIILIMLLVVGRPAHYEWHHSLGWNPGLYKRRKS